MQKNIPTIFPTRSSPCRSFLVFFVLMSFFAIPTGKCSDTLPKVIIILADDLGFRDVSC